MICGYLSLVRLTLFLYYILFEESLRMNNCEFWFERLLLFSLEFVLSVGKLGDEVNGKVVHLWI